MRRSIHVCEADLINLEIMGLPIEPALTFLKTHKKECSLWESLQTSFIWICKKVQISDHKNSDILLRMQDETIDTYI